MLKCRHDRYGIVYTDLTVGNVGVIPSFKVCKLQFTLQRRVKIIQPNTEMDDSPGPMSSVESLRVP